MRFLHQLAIGTGILLMVLPPQVEAQSGSRRSGEAATTRRRSTLATPAPVECLLPERPLVACDGADPVVLVETGTVRPGQPGREALFGSQIFRFGDEESRSKFEATPGRFIPVLAGESVVAWQDQRFLFFGSPRFASVHNDRLYLFRSAEEKGTFDANPEGYQDADLLIGGYCPVSLVDRHALIAGLEEEEALFEGRRIRFASAAERELFLANPAKYFPVLAGVDPVSAMKEAPTFGQPRHAIAYKNRLFLFSSLAHRDEFLRSPARYADLDVAAGGTCPVTWKESGRKTPGDFQTAAFVLGRRYLFADAAARSRFLADPAPYLEALRRQ